MVFINPVTYYKASMRKLACNYNSLISIKFPPFKLLYKETVSMFMLKWKFFKLPYNQNYWQVLYLAICSKNAIDRVLNGRFCILYGKKPMLAV